MSSDLRLPLPSAVRVGVSVVHVFVATALLVLSHLGLSDTGRGFTAAMREGAQRAGAASVGLLVLACLGLAVLAWRQPVLTRAARRTALLYGAIVLTGLPWTFLSVVVANALALTSFWGVAKVGTAIGFVCWLRVLARGPLSARN